MKTADAILWKYIHGEQIYISDKHREAIFKAMEEYASQFKNEVPSDELIQQMAIKEIPYDEDAGNVEDDIDHAKRQLIILGAKLMRDKLTK